MAHPAERDAERDARHPSQRDSHPGARPHPPPPAPRTAAAGTAAHTACTLPSPSCPHAPQPHRRDTDSEDDIEVLRACIEQESTRATPLWRAKDVQQVSIK
eukprot:COSAG01_NODE_1805_length_9192_cov_13.807324_7_plen_101_part_00